MVTKNRKEFRKIAGAYLACAVLLLQSNAIEKMEERAAKIQLHKTHQEGFNNYRRAQRAWEELKQAHKFRNNIVDLDSASEEFLHEATKLREALEQENRDLQKFGETVVNILGYLGGAIIDDKLKNPEAKSFFLNLLDNVKEQGSRFFKQ